MADPIYLTIDQLPAGSTGPATYGDVIARRDLSEATLSSYTKKDTYGEVLRLGTVGVIADLAGLVVADIPNGLVITVQGKSAVDDGGGGLFVYRAGSTSPADGAMFVQPSAGDGRWHRMFTTEINVKWFGAKGDGTTDDTAALQAALTFFDNYPIVGGELASNGAIHIPRGRYKVTSMLTLHHAYGTKLYGDGMFNTALEFNTTTATLLRVDSYFGVSITDISFHNTNGSGNSASLQNGTVGLLLDSDGTGSLSKVERCCFTNWVHCTKTGGTTSGDSGLWEQCHYRRSTNAWYTDNDMAGIQKFDQCVYDLITLGAVNTQGVGQIHIDSPNFVGSGSLLYLRPAFAEWGYGSNYIVTNGKMEWTAPSSMWINMPAGAEIFGDGTATFNNCSMSGGDGGEVSSSDVIMQLCGAMNVQWNGGNFNGTVKYLANTSLTQANPATENRRAEVVFNGLKRAPLPEDIIFDGATGGKSIPNIVWRGCGNMLDLEMGGSMGYSQRQRHTLKYQPYWFATTEGGSSPYQNEVDFHGLTVRIDSALYVIDSGATPVGPKTAELFSDSGYTTSLGGVTFTDEGQGVWALSLNSDPTIIVDKLYLQVERPSADTTWGHWVIDYTVIG